MFVGITGHQSLSDSGGWETIKGQLRRLLDGIEPPLVGLSSLAAGADQLFASLVLSLGGDLVVVLPFEGYGRSFGDDHSKRSFRRLLARAARVEHLACQGEDEECYRAAGRRVVDESDILIAVWDGQPAKGIGGTADVVAYAKEIGKTVFLVDAARWR
jgi:hypothetical protein